MKKRDDLIYPEMSYEIVGILYDVYNQLGFGHKEKFYQNAIALALKGKNFIFKEQLYVPLLFNEKVVGRYFLDFLIDHKVVLEIKKDSIFYKKHIDQVFGYLKANNLKLGILANFTKSGVRYKRIVNVR